MARTTLNLDPVVLRELRERSQRERKTLGDLASQLLARSLKDLGERPDREFKWISRDLGEPMVDLEDKEALNAALDSDR